MQNDQLGQVRPSDTNATLIFTPDEGNDKKQWEGESIVACNRSAAVAKASVYHDKDGTTYDDDTVLVNEDDLQPNETRVYALGIKGRRDTDHVAVKSDTANAINFTMYGKREF